ncbi:hypothetical protein D3C86_646870 [compost metagenome]
MVIGVDHRLVVHCRVNRGDRHVIEANGLVEQAQQRHAAIGRTGGVGHQQFVAGQAILIDAVNDGGVDIRLAGHWLREQHTWRASVEKTLAVFTGVIGTGTLKHQIDAQ